MITIDVRNVHEALPAGIRNLARLGYREDSRNGAVQVFPTPVSTRYRQPDERVIFHPLRDANPFFHLYEALWMLAGRNDVKSVAHYVKRMAEFSDNGKTFHGAYGYRWRKHFGYDQLATIIHALKNNPKDRRTVLQMWDARKDLGREGKDFPCNTQATFRVNPLGELDMMVSNRSNDMIWGAYGANAVHFSMLQEYVAGCLQLPLGSYWQVSANFHAYEATLAPLLSLGYSTDLDNPYLVGEVVPMRMINAFETQAQFDLDLAVYMERGPITGFTTQFFRLVVTPMHYAHESWKQGGPFRKERTVEILNQMLATNDWRKAALEWVGRRKD